MQERHGSFHIGQNRLRLLVEAVNSDVRTTMIYTNVRGGHGVRRMADRLARDPNECLAEPAYHGGEGGEEMGTQHQIPHRSR